jgi:hypothetical protein
LQKLNPFLTQLGGEETAFTQVVTPNGTYL